MGWPLSPKKEAIEVKPDATPNEPPKESQEEIFSRLLEKTFSPVNERLNAISTDLEALKSKPAPTPPADTAVASVLDNEDAAFAQRQAPIIAHQLMIQGQFIRDKVSREYGDLYDKFKGEIEGEIGKWAPQYQANEQAVRDAIDKTIGKHAREQGLAFDADGKKFFLEDASQVVDQSTPEAKADREFMSFRVSVPTKNGGTKEVTRRHFLEKMGIDPKEAQKSFSKLQVVS